MKEKKRRQEAAEAAEREKREREAAEAAAAAAAAQDAVDRAQTPEQQPQGTGHICTHKATSLISLNIETNEINNVRSL